MSIPTFLPPPNLNHDVSRANRSRCRSGRSYPMANNSTTQGTPRGLVQGKGGSFVGLAPVSNVRSSLFIANVVHR
jgi:hypothetical protein